MMLSKFTFFVAVLAFSFVSFASANAEEEVDFSTLEALGYKATGDTKRCVSHSQIRKTDVIDDYTILFHMTGKKVYANIMERRCYGLARERSIKYEVRGGTLCNIDTIEVFSPLSTGVSCSLGDFYEIEKVPTQANEETPNLEDPAQ